MKHSRTVVCNHCSKAVTTRTAVIRKVKTEVINKHFDASGNWCLGGNGSVDSCSTEVDSQTHKGKQTHMSQTHRQTRIRRHWHIDLQDSSWESNYPYDVTVWHMQADITQFGQTCHHIEVGALIRSTIQPTAQHIEWRIAADWHTFAIVQCDRSEAESIVRQQMSVTQPGDTLADSRNWRITAVSQSQEPTLKPTAAVDRSDRPTAHYTIPVDKEPTQHERYVLTCMADIIDSRNKAAQQSQEPQTAADSRIADAIAQFPATFGIHAWPGSTFRINARDSYVDGQGQAILYTDIFLSGSWESFAKGTAAELCQEMIAVGQEPTDTAAQPTAQPKVRRPKFGKAKRKLQ